MFTIFVIIFIVLMLLITLPLLIVCMLLKKKHPDKSLSLAIFAGRIWAKGCLLFGFIKVEVIGKENIPDEPVLFVGNHRSFFDIPVFYAKCPKHAGFISKKSIEKVPILSGWMKGLNCLFLDRDNIKEGLKTILQGIDYIKKGGSLFIFPEGTRAKTKEMLEFKEGSLKLASKSNCKVVPVAFIGTDDRFENNKLGVKPGKCKMIFGKPFNTNEIPEEYQKTPARYTREVIKNLLEENE